MAAVLQYVNSSGNKFERVWEVGDGRKFTALIKCYIQHPGEQNIQTIEKPSTRPATFAECYNLLKS